MATSIATFQAILKFCATKNLFISLFVRKERTKIIQVLQKNRWLRWWRVILRKESSDHDKNFVLLLSFECLVKPGTCNY